MEILAIVMVVQLVCLMVGVLRVRQVLDKIYALQKITAR